jgi:LCP family protein required for cell wall assembly
MSASTSGRARVPGAPYPGGAGVGRATIPTNPRGPARAPGGPGGPGGPPPGVSRGGQYRGGKRRPRWGRIALVVGLALALVGGGIAFFAFRYVHHLDAQVARTDPFSKINQPRPDKVVSGAMNVLILGSDSRNPDSTSNSRTDTIILMHVPADHKHAYLISIPRDSYVYIPKSPTNPNEGDTHAKINSAYAWGGATLAVETVEKLTNVRIDHVVLIDFSGFQQVTDALGGVDMYVDKTITSIHPPHRVFKKGQNHFTGAEALDYVRQRYQFADGDITREKHQQAFMKAIMDKAVSTGTITNPTRLNAFLQSVTKAVTVDKDMSVLDTLLQFRNLRSSDLTFMTTPFTGFGTRNGESVVLLDEKKAAALFGSVSHDTLSTTGTGG